MASRVAVDRIEMQFERVARPPLHRTVEARADAVAGLVARAHLRRHGHRVAAAARCAIAIDIEQIGDIRSEEHTSELQSLMRISYSVFCLQTKTRKSSHCLYVEYTHALKFLRYISYSVVFFYHKTRH